jgi:hypothetical protein
MASPASNLFLPLPPNPFQLQFKSPQSPITSESASSNSSSSPVTDESQLDKDSYSFWPSFLNILEDEGSAPRATSPSLRTAAQSLAKELGLPSPSSEHEQAPSQSRVMQQQNRQPAAYGFGLPRTISPALPSTGSDRAPSPKPTSPGQNILWLGDLEHWMEEGYLVRSFGSSSFKR